MIEPDLFSYGHLNFDTGTFNPLTSKVAMLRASSVLQFIVSSRDVSFGNCRPATIEQVCLLVQRVGPRH